MKHRIAILAVLLAATLLVTASAPLEGQEKFRETYEAFAVVMGTSNPPIIPRGVSTTLQINVTRWSTPEEINSILGALIEKGQPEAVKLLQEQEETGWVRARTGGPSMNTFPREVLRYARKVDLPDGGRRTILALDRPISMAEAVYQPRWRDHDITLIVMETDAEGKGQGQLAMGVKIVADHENKTLVIENFGTEPVRLNNLRKIN